MGERIDTVSCMQRDLGRIASVLAASLQLILLLIPLKFSLTSEGASSLPLFFHPDVLAYNATPTEQRAAGWEELANASLRFLLSTSFPQPVAAVKGNVISNDASDDGPLSINDSHPVKSHPATLGPKTLNFPVSTERLHLYIALTYGRLSHGGPPIESLGADHAKPPHQAAKN